MATNQTLVPGAMRRRREQRHFDHLARTHGETWWGHRRPAGRVRLARKAAMLCTRLDRLDDPRVLEIGCGTGVFTRAILDRCPALRIVAMDISPDSVALARSRCAGFDNLRVHAADVFEWDDPDGAYDAVVGNSVLHHLCLDPVLSRALALLAPGGMLWFSEPNMLNPQIAAERHLRRVGRWLDNSEDETAFIRWRIGRALHRAGFVGVEVRPFDFLHPLSPRFAIPLVDRLGRSMERWPLMRELAGSLCIVAHKPGGDSPA